MTPNNTKTKYFLYARKSTEDDGKQVQSIEDQISKLEETAKRLELKIVEVFTEEKSAKKPDNRPIFSEMIKRIKAGEVNGILCWKLNRLSRNPQESGMVQQLLHDGLLVSIQTYDKEYTIEDNDIIFGVETNSASQFIKDLREDVCRGLRSKVKKGIRPNGAPVGYLNTKIQSKGENFIIPDPERFELVRKMWDLMLTGGHTVPEILKIVNKGWGFRTKKTKKLGGKELSRSALYRIFTNVFYTGMHYYYMGELHTNGTHKPMITLLEYDRVQEILGRKGKPRPKTHTFPFRGPIYCSECGCLVTAEVQKRITYYHCTGRKKDYKCSQKRRWVRADDLELQIKAEIDKITILPEFRDWALERLREFNLKECEDRKNIYETQHKTLVSSHHQLEKLVDMKLQDQLTDKEYNAKRNALLLQISDLEEKLKNTQQRVKDWLKKTEKAFDFATNAHGNFIKGDYAVKKKILLGLGSNFILKDGKLKIEDAEWLVPIKENYKPLEKQYLKFELDKTLSQKEKEAALIPLRSSWRELRDDYRTFLRNNIMELERLKRMLAA